MYLINDITSIVLKSMGKSVEASALQGLGKEAWPETELWLERTSTKESLWGRNLLTHFLWTNQQRCMFGHITMRVV